MLDDVWPGECGKCRLEFTLGKNELTPLNAQQLAHDIARSQAGFVPVSMLLRRLDANFHVGIVHRYDDTSDSQVQDAIQLPY